MKVKPAPSAKKAAPSRADAKQAKELAQKRAKEQANMITQLKAAKARIHAGSLIGYFDACYVCSCKKCLMYFTRIDIQKALWQ